MTDIHFYSDTLEWGGHELLSCFIANQLANNSTYRVVFFYRHEKFVEELSKNVFKIEIQQETKTPFPLFREVISKQWRSLVDLFIKEDVKNLVVCQGNIERCVSAIRAGHYLNLNLISYIPMGYSQKESLAPLGLIRDILSQWIYKKVDKWIVCSKDQKKLIERWLNETSKVEVINIPVLWTERRSLRTIQRNTLHIMVIGRIFFKQKRQDQLLEISKQLSRQNVKHKIFVIGVGPDRSRLEKAIKKQKLNDYFQLEDWQSSESIKNILVESTDILIIPSRFEGGPTILYEALTCGTGILVASEQYVDSYNLPEWMKFTPGDSIDAASKIANYRKNWSENVYEECRERLLSERTTNYVSNQIRDVFDKF